MSRRSDCPLSDRVADGLLERGAEIRERLPRGRSVLPHVGQHRGLQPAEGEIERRARAPRKPARKVYRLGIARARQAVDVRAARIRQPQELCDLVERLSSGVVQRVSKRAVLADGAHLVERSVAAGDYQRQPGGHGSLLREQHGQQVPLDVVDADEGKTRRRGQRLSHLDADEERAHQARTASHRDALELIHPAPRLSQCLVEHRKHALQVVARSQLGHHPAPLLVHVLLGVDHVREHGPAQALAELHHRGGGLVAARLQPEDAHRAQV